MELNEVLLIENDEVTASRVEDALKSEDVVVHLAKNDDEMVNRFADNPGIQIVILDWLLEDDSSVIAKLCLQKLRENWFVPVVIWSVEIDKYEGESDEVHEFFPSPCISKHSKSQVQAGDLLGILREWHSTPPMSIFNSFKKSATRAIDQSFYNLASHSAEDLEKGLKSLFALEEGQMEIDIEHPIDVLTRMISRIIYSDNDFISQLSEFLSALDFSKELTKQEKKIKSMIQNYHMYYQPRSEDHRIRSGDIVKIKYRIDDNKVIRKAIVITPACDLAIPGKTEFVRLLSIYSSENVKDEHAYDKWVFWEEGNKKVVKFHDIVILRNESYKDEKHRKAVMSYEHEYHTATETVVQIERLKRLEDPYRADLIHKFVSHAGRIGMPLFDATL